MLSLGKHFPDGCELAFCQQAAAEKIIGELNSDFPDVLGVATTLLPYVFQALGADQNEFIFTDFLHAVPHNPADSGPMLDKVQLEFLVAVKRICKLRLVTLNDMEAILFRQLGNFREY